NRVADKIAEKPTEPIEIPTGMYYANGAQPGPVAFVFPGQGSQYPGMGRELVEASDIVRDVVDRGLAIADPLLPVPLREVWFAVDDPRIHDTTYTQAALFILQVALAEQWRALGVRPSAVAGHSIGQVAAAWAAGVLSFEDGVRLCAARGRLMGALPAGGGMLAVFAPEVQVRPALAGHPGVDVAAVNHRDEVVLSGPETELDALATELAATDVESRKLTVSHAFHSSLMDPMLDEFEAVAASVTWRAPTLPLLCNRDGGFVRAEDVTKPAYWRDLVRSPVRFAENLATLTEAGHRRFLELGPHTQLTGLARRQQQGTFVASLARDHDARHAFAAAQAALWVAGQPIDWTAATHDLAVFRRTLPTYPFERVRCWIDAPEFPEPSAPTVGPVVEASPPPKGRWFVPRFVEVPLPADAEEPPIRGAWVVHGDGPAAEALRSALNDRGAVIVDHLDAADAVAWVAGASDHESESLLPVIQALADRAAPPPLYVLTTGAQPAERAVTTPGGSALYGLLRAAALEAPAMRIVAVDRAPDQLTPEPWLAAWADAREPEQAFTDARRLVRRLLPTDPPAFPGTRAPKSALVTGGLRGIGLALASRWASRGAERLVLVGRSAPRDQARQAIDAMRAAGCDVAVVQIDLASDEAVETIRVALGETPPEIAIHAAGTLDDRALAAHDADSMRMVFAPKVTGTRHLLAALEGRMPTRVVLMGAGASLLGAPGQANYAAANAWLAGFAHLCRAQGLPVVTVDWGPWADTGMAARLGEDHAARQAAQGIRPLSLDEGLRAIEEVSLKLPPQAAYVDVDWPVVAESLFAGTRPAVLDRLLPAPVTPRDVDRPSPPAVATTADTVARLAAELLGRQAVDRTVPLVDQGLDSLLAVQLKNELLDEGMDLPIGELVGGPSVERIVELLEGSPVAEPTASVLGHPPERRGPHPVITHGLAFVVGVLFVVVGYAIGFEVFGPRLGLPETAEERRSGLPSNALGPVHQPESFPSHSRSRRGTHP
ncbi:MAG: SDR family NAD(P)-dependent oxidoreductase, partial [Myxococcota bacterium]